MLWQCRSSQLMVFALGASATLLLQTILSYTSTYLVNSAGMSRPEAIQLRLLGVLVLLVALPFFGALSDCVGRRPLLLAGFGLSAVALYPIFAGYRSGSFGLSLVLHAAGCVIVAALL